MRASDNRVRSNKRNNQRNRSRLTLKRPGHASGPIKDPNFGFEVPVAVPGVDNSILDPRSTWADKDEYDRTAAKLVDLFIENFAQFADQVDEGVRQAAPKAERQQAQAQSHDQTTPA